MVTSCYIIKGMIGWLLDDIRHGSRSTTKFFVNKSETFLLKSLNTQKYSPIRSGFVLLRLFFPTPPGLELAARPPSYRGPTTGLKVASFKKLDLKAVSQ